MNTAAMQAMQKCRAVLKMDSSPLRFEWVSKYIGMWEPESVVMRRRRAMLTRAGVHLSAQSNGWDDLSEITRKALNSSHLG